MDMNKLSFFVALFALLIIGTTAHAQPLFKGGEQALNNFLKDHIIYPEFASKNCIEATIRVSFRVDKGGMVSDVKAYRGPGIDLDDEAVRVIKMTTGKWTLPAGQEAGSVVLPIRFAPDYGHCATATKMSMDEAIRAYQNRQELENAVTNYYENKYLGKADTTKQAYIDGLKVQLGFDDELIDDVLKQAEGKLKQGDQDGACTDWKFIRNIGSARADRFIAQYCK
jgi:TonB family protein